MSITLLVYVHGSGIEIDLHPQLYQKYKNLHGEEVHVDTPSKLSKKNQEFVEKLKREESFEDRKPVVKKLVSRLLSE